MSQDFGTLNERLDKYDLRAKKSLGQNFLMDNNILRKILQVSGHIGHTNIIEIGPGPASLTCELLNGNAQTVTAIELDKRCLPLLSDLQKQSDHRLKVIYDDALKVDITEITEAPRAIVANLPYNVATPLLIHWLEVVFQNPSSLDFMVLMFQKEVGKRIAAKPSSKAYGRLSVISQWLCDVEYCFDVSPQCFVPAPKVTSAIIKLTPYEKPLYPADKERLEKVVATAFGQRRKMLRSSLKALFGENVESLLSQLGIDPTRRAETLTVEEFCKLSTC